MLQWLKKLDNLFFIVGRSLLGLYFIGPGLGKIFDYASTLALMKMKGVPFTAALLPVTIAIQLLGGIYLVLGKNLRLTAFDRRGPKIDRTGQHLNRTGAHFQTNWC